MVGEAGKGERGWHYGGEHSTCRQNETLPARAGRLRSTCSSCFSPSTPTVTHLQSECHSYKKPYRRLGKALFDKKREQKLNHYLPKPKHTKTPNSSSARAFAPVLPEGSQSRRGKNCPPPQNDRKTKQLWQLLYAEVKDFLKFSVSEDVV